MFIALTFDVETLDLFCLLLFWFDAKLNKCDLICRPDVGPPQIPSDPPVLSVFERSVLSAAQSQCELVSL